MESDDVNNSDEIVKTIVHFKLKTDLTIDKFYIEGYNPPQFGGFSSNNDDKKSRWSFDISDVCVNGSKYFILVAVSHIADDDMRRVIHGKRKEKGKTVIYPIELLKVQQESYVFHQRTHTVYQKHEISGICKFAEVPKIKNDDHFVLRRFIIFNSNGMHSFNYKDGFELDETFYYPKCIRRELDSLDPSEISSCTVILRSCIYNKYFLIEQYKNNVQLLEGNNQILIIFYVYY